MFAFSRPNRSVVRRTVGGTVAIQSRPQNSAFVDAGPGRLTDYDDARRRACERMRWVTSSARDVGGIMTHVMR